MQKIKIKQLVSTHAICGCKLICKFCLNHCLYSINYKGQR